MTLKQFIKSQVAELDSRKLDYFRKYANEYYNDRFRKGQGTETILEMIRKFAPGGKWLDVGAGPATLFWSLLMPHVSRLDCSEIDGEGLVVLDEFFESKDIPVCYQDVIEQYEIEAFKLQEMRGAPREYYLFDALKTWPELPNQPYDIISVFGVFGLCSSPERYISSFQFPRSALVKNGILMGANWVRSQKLVDEIGGDNRYLSVDLVRNAADRFGYQVLHLSEEIIGSDPNYDRVIVWCLKA